MWRADPLPSGRHIKISVEKTVSSIAISLTDIIEFESENGKLKTPIPKFTISSAATLCFTLTASMLVG